MSRRSWRYERKSARQMLLADLNNDGQLDIWVGNDFLMPDHIWLRSADSWEEAQPFPMTAENTMSLEAGDIDNDGQVEFFAADMMPINDDAETQAAWMPLMEKMPDVSVEGQAVHERAPAPMARLAMNRSRTMLVSWLRAGVGPPSSGIWIMTVTGSLHCERHGRRGTLRPPTNK